VPLKICTKCNAEKQESEFHSHRETADRLRPECKECIKAYHRAYHLRNRDVQLEKQRIYKAANKDAISAAGAIYYEKNRETIIARVDRYRHENYESVLQVLRNRRARKKNAAGSHTKQDIQALILLQKGKCAACMAKLRIEGKGKYHIDHIVSLARGGSNDKYNLQILCPSCNLSKHAKDPIEWAQKNGRLL
jgi:5-methylcytosine-specific restriction endonuclease McrA